MCHVAIIAVSVLIVLLYIVDEMVAAVVGEVECEVLVVDARHLVAVVIDEVGIINEVIQIVCLDNQAVAVESRHVAHLVVAIESVISGLVRLRMLLRPASERLMMSHTSLSVFLI